MLKDVTDDQDSKITKRETGAGQECHHTVNCQERQTELVVSMNPKMGVVSAKLHMLKMNV